MNTQAALAMPSKSLRTLALLFAFALAPCAVTFAQAQDAAAQAPAQDGIALAPARFEIEMEPGSETTVVVNLDYHTAKPNAQASRILATLNDWNLTREGGLEFFKAGTRAASASPWLVYSPGEVLVQPGQTHSIRVTISVPKNAAPGDHLAALVIEQRPDTIKLNKNERQMLLRYRMASLFYVKVPQLTRDGTLAGLKATATDEGVVVSPTLKNAGNSVVRPVASLSIQDAAGKVVAEMPEGETLPVLANSELTLRLEVPQPLPPGHYSVSYKVNFQGHGKPTEGVTKLVVGERTNAPAATNANTAPSQD